jgi:hypothetical protein
MAVRTDNRPTKGRSSGGYPDRYVLFLCDTNNFERRYRAIDGIERDFWEEKTVKHNM